MAFGKLAKRYQEEAFREVASQLLDRLGGDPLAVAACARDLILRSGASTPPNFWSFIPSGVEATEVLTDISRGVFLNLDHDRDSTVAVVGHLLNSVGYVSQSETLKNASLLPSLYLAFCVVLDRGPTRLRQAPEGTPKSRYVQAEALASFEGRCFAPWVSIRRRVPSMVGPSDDPRGQHGPGKDASGHLCPVLRSG